MAGGRLSLSIETATIRLSLSKADVSVIAFYCLCGDCTPPSLTLNGINIAVFQVFVGDTEIWFLQLQTKYIIFVHNTSQLRADFHACKYEI